MKTVDRLQEPDMRIVKALYDDWKKDKKGELSFDAESRSISDLLAETGMNKNQAGPHLKNLQNFEFIEYDKENVKLLPSGINYALGVFDKNIH
jgi:hypothetical protein